MSNEDRMAEAISLQQWLENHSACGDPYFALSVQQDGHGGCLHVVLHPLNRDGDTLDLFLRDNTAYRNEDPGIEDFYASGGYVGYQESRKGDDWNSRVRVCRDHTAEIVDGSCVICELEALRGEQGKGEVSDAERGKFFVTNAEWIRDEDTTLMAIRLPHDVDLSCKAFRKDAMDKLVIAARNAGGES